SLASAFCAVAPPAEPVTGVLAESSPIWTPQPASRTAATMQHNDLTVIGLIASLQSCFIPRCLGHTEWGVFYFFSEVRSMGGVYAPSQTAWVSQLAFSSVSLLTRNGSDKSSTSVNSGEGTQWPRIRPKS